MKKGYDLIEVIIIVIVASIISAVSTGVLITKSFNNDGNYTYADIAKDKSLQEFIKVYSKINSSYYKDINKDEAIKSAINGLTSYLDETYTGILDKNKANLLLEDLNATYDGIGITIDNNVIVHVIKDSPAYNAGIQSDDLIIAINDVDVSLSSGEEISNLLKENQKNIKISVKRGEEILSFENISFSKLDVPRVEYKIIDNTNIGYMQILLFSNSVSEQAENALEELRSKNIDGLIIDLRNNTGGFLEEAYKTSELFLEKGKIIYSLKDKDNNIKSFKDKTTEKYNNSIIILINEQTASAAEILTLALKESGNAIIVGTTSYGKGKVQHTYSLSSGELIKYTSSYWLSPNGTCIDEKGIKPDYNIENETGKDNEGNSYLIDKQLEKSIEILKGE